MIHPEALKLKMIRSAKKLYHLWKCNLAILEPKYEYAIVDAFDHMKTGNLSDKQLLMLHLAYQYDRDKREERKKLKLETRRSMPTAWQRAKKR